MEEGLEPAVLQLSDSAADFAAGGLAGACGVMAGQPLDTVRIRQQASNSGSGSAQAGAVVRSILAAEGARSLFRGMAYPLGTAALQNAVVFQAYGAAARFMTGSAPPQQQAQQAQQGQKPPALSLSQVFWAGCFAGVVQTAVVVPVDLLKIRLQLQTAVRGAPGYIGPLALLAGIVRSEGVRGLYRGTAITCVRDFPSHGVYFTVYEGATGLLDPGRRSTNALALWAAGGLAGAASWLSIYPIDLIKTRIQAAAASQSPYKGWLDCARQAYAAEGPSVFFQGLSTTLGRAFLVNGVIFTAYELSHKLVQPQQQVAAAAGVGGDDARSMTEQ